MGSLDMKASVSRDDVTATAMWSQRSQRRLSENPTTRGRKLVDSSVVIDVTTALPAADEAVQSQLSSRQNSGKVSSQEEYQMKSVLRQRRSPSLPHCERTAVLSSEKLDKIPARPRKMPQKQNPVWTPRAITPASLVLLLEPLSSGWGYLRRFIL